MAQQLVVVGIQDRFEVEIETLTLHLEVATSDWCAVQKHLAVTDHAMAQGELGGVQHHDAHFVGTERLQHGISVVQRKPGNLRMVDGLGKQDGDVDVTQWSFGIPRERAEQIHGHDARIASKGVRKPRKAGTDVRRQAGPFDHAGTVLDGHASNKRGR